VQLISAALWSTYRIFVAYFLSLAFGIFYGVSASSGPRREKIMIAILDILQSVPILGFFPVAIAFFVAVFRGQRIGLELAAHISYFYLSSVEHRLRCIRDSQNITKGISGSR